LDVVGEVLDGFEVVNVDEGAFGHVLQVVGFIVAAGYDGNRCARDRVHQLFGHVVFAVGVFDGEHELVFGVQFDIACN